MCIRDRVCSSHPASFRFEVALDTLAFGYILPTTGWIWDFNPVSYTHLDVYKRQYPLSAYEKWIGADNASVQPLLLYLIISKLYSVIVCICDDLWGWVAMIQINNPCQNLSLIHI